MKIVDNFEKFRKIINFANDDEFYYIQIFVRGKDGYKGIGVNGNNKNRLVKFYTIRSVEEFNRVEPEIKSICDQVNARAYIHVTKRSFSGVAKQMLKDIVEMYTSENYQGMKSAFSTVCGTTYIHSDKTFLIDVDEPFDLEKCVDMMEFLKNECEPIGVYKFKMTVPTLHGYHIITSPFNVEKFKEHYSHDIHKNNPTLLYYKSTDEAC